MNTELIRSVISPSRWWIVMVLAFATPFVFAMSEAGSAEKGAANNLVERKGWVLGFDNDIFVPGGRDQDYTYGLNVSFLGLDATEQWFSSHHWLVNIDSLLGLSGAKDVPITNNAIEYGLFGFTPEDTSVKGPNNNDRPYASLIYTSSSREWLSADLNSATQTTLTLGVLGLGVVGDLQDGLHQAIGNERPRGWKSQVSEGGELTFRYNFSRQHLLFQQPGRLELKRNIQASFGYITETSWSLGFRSGKIRSPWSAFKPERATYGESATPLKSVSRISEHFLWGGISFKLRAYNAFLQGQFRNSEVKYSRGDLNNFIAEGWLGYTFVTKDGYSFSYYVRGHTSEVAVGDGNRAVLWGGLQVARFI